MGQSEFECGRRCPPRTGPVGAGVGVWGAENNGLAAYRKMDGELAGLQGTGDDEMDLGRGCETSTSGIPKMDVWMDGMSTLWIDPPLALLRQREKEREGKKKARDPSVEREEKMRETRGFSVMGATGLLLRMVNWLVGRLMGGRYGAGVSCRGGISQQCDSDMRVTIWTQSGS